MAKEVLQYWRVRGCVEGPEKEEKGIIISSGPLGGWAASLKNASTYSLSCANARASMCKEQQWLVDNAPRFRFGILGVRGTV